MALVCKRIAQHTLRYMYTHLTWVFREHTGSGSVAKRIPKIEETVETSTNLQCVRKVDIQLCTSTKSLKLLGNMTGVSKLSISFGYAHDSSQTYFTCEDFERLYGDTLLPKLEELTIAPLRMEDLKVLSKARRLETLKVILGGQNPDLTKQDLKRSGTADILFQTVGLEQKNYWPELKVVCYENIWDPNPHHDDDGDDDLNSQSVYHPNGLYIRFTRLKSVFRQYLLHRGYDVKFTKPFEMRLSHLMHLPCQKECNIRATRLFIRWLRRVNGPDADDIFWMTGNRYRQPPAGSHEKQAELENRLLLFYQGPIKFKLSGWLAPIYGAHDTDRLLDILASKIQRLTFLPTGFFRAEGELPEPHQDEINWTRFLKKFLSKCKGMTEFRLRWEEPINYAHFPLRTFAQQLAGLCRNFRLRVLDIDVSTLMGPPAVQTYIFNDEELCAVNKHLSWINVPEQLPGRRNSDELMLLNLRELTLRNMCINSRAEFEWFMSLTTLKKLEKLRIDGLVWHRGPHRLANVYGWVYQIPDEGDEEDPNNYDSFIDMNCRVPEIWNDKAWDGDDAEKDNSSS
ncbi:hypothetical protein BZA77DRAFT_368249 [Pyronema omphalodes]|nr:hypothetical protein BZA77DRAFT_368249 [Pyronema omphalodes]